MALDFHRVCNRMKHSVHFKLATPWPIGKRSCADPATQTSDSVTNPIQQWGNKEHEKVDLLFVCNISYAEMVFFNKTHMFNKEIILHHISTIQKIQIYSLRNAQLHKNTENIYLLRNRKKRWRKIQPQMFDDNVQELCAPILWIRNNPEPCQQLVKTF